MYSSSDDFEKESQLKNISGKQASFYLRLVFQMQIGREKWIKSNEKFCHFFDLLDVIDFVKRTGKTCHGEYSWLLRNVRSLEEAKEKCLKDEQCKSILRRPYDYFGNPLSCDEADSNNDDNSDYSMCYVGYSYADSLTHCVYEKTGLFWFSYFRYLFALWNLKWYSSQCKFTWN